MRIRGIGIKQIKEAIVKGAKTLRSDGSLVAEYRCTEMEKLNYPCPCGGRVKWACGSKYFPEESMEIVEDKLKEKGLWGSRKEVKIWKSGSSVVIRLPTEISRSMDLSKVKKGYIYPEGKRKILFEF